MDYLNNTFHSNTNDVWDITDDVMLSHLNGATYILTDYTPELNIGDTEYYTIIIGTVGECLKYIHNNIRSLK